MDAISNPTADITRPTSATSVTGPYRKTLGRLFEHPTNHHVDWNGVRELIDHIGAVKQLSNHRFELTVGASTTVFLKPHTSHLSESNVLEVRQFLKAAGWGPAELEREAEAAADPVAAAAVYLTRHAATVYRLDLDGAADAARADDAATGEHFAIKDDGKTHVFEAIARTLAKTNQIIIIEHLADGEGPGSDLADYLRQSHRHAPLRSVHEVMVDDADLNPAALRKLAADTLHVSI